MNKREWERRAHLESVLLALGFTAQEAEQLRRISSTLQHWHELECGTGDGQVTRSIEREDADGTGLPFLRVQYPTAAGYVDRRSPIPDREAGAKKRLGAILTERNRRAGQSKVPGAPGSKWSEWAVREYIQTDPRGAALYILRPGDVPEGKDADAYYTRGVCVY